MSIWDAPTNRLEEHILNVVHHQIAYLSFYSGPDKNEGWVPEGSLDPEDDDS